MLFKCNELHNRLNIDIGFVNSYGKFIVNCGFIYKDGEEGKVNNHMVNY